VAKRKPAGGLFPEWQAEQAAKAAMDPTRDVPKRMRDMLRLRGRTEGHTCGDCVHLVTVVRSGKWFKCDQARITRGAGTDWRKGWPACGLWQAGEQKTIHLWG